MNGINATLKDGRITCDDCDRLRSRLAAAERERNVAIEQAETMAAATKVDVQRILSLETERDAARAESARLANDRDEWRTQHENLLAMYQAEVEKTAALGAELVGADAIVHELQGADENAARLAKRVEALEVALRGLVNKCGALGIGPWTCVLLLAANGPGVTTSTKVPTADVAAFLEATEQARAALAGEETKSSERVCDFCGTCMVDGPGAFVVCPVCGEEKCTATCIPAGNGTTCLDCEDRQTAEEPKP